MAKFRVIGDNGRVTLETTSHSEDLQLMRRLLNEGKKFSYEKFGKTMNFG